MKLHNRGGLGLDTSRNVSGILNSSLQRCDHLSFSILLFTFSAIKRPVKELRLSFMSKEKYVNKIFLLFSGSESNKCHRTKRSNRMNYRSTNDPCRRLFQVQPLLPPGFPESLTPSCENVQNSISQGGGGVGGVWFFLEQPNSSL